MRRIVFVVIVVIGILMVLGIGRWFYLKFSNPVLFPVKIGEKWGYIDREGKIVINPQFDLASVYASFYN